MVLSFWGVSLSFVVSGAIIVVLNRNGSALTPNANLTFCELSDDNVVGAGKLAVLFHLFEARITFLFPRLFSPL